MVDATCIFFSRPGEPVSEVFRRAKRIYEKFDHPHEWTLDYQGNFVGYSPREVLLTPDSTLILEADTASGLEPQRRLGPHRGHGRHRLPRLRGRHRAPRTGPSSRSPSRAS